MGKIVSIKRFEIHDGDGIRTTVFLKGCPLNCKWCHNPECIRSLNELAVYTEKCTLCGACTQVCSAHQIINSQHLFDRSRCEACGKCTTICPAGALKVYGSSVSMHDILPVLLEDLPFYNASGGGVTISGGEPLLQPDFTATLLKELHNHEVHTALDTCGAVSLSVLQKVIPWVDIFLYDIKAIDEDVHIAWTGLTNKNILENLRYLDSMDIPVEIRVPYIPTLTNTQIHKIGEFLSTIHVVTKVKVLPYHDFAKSKYDALGQVYEIPDLPRPSKEEINNTVRILESYGLRAENGGVL